jgi:hypothetical protein
MGTKSGDFAQRGVMVTGNTSTAAASFNSGPPVYDSLLYNGKELIWTDNKGVSTIYAGTSGALGKQNSKYQYLRDKGPLPEGSYTIDLMLDTNRQAEVFSDSGETKPNFGIQRLPYRFTTTSGVVISYENWGNSRARLSMISGNSYGRDNFYIHNSTKGFSHGCLEVGSGFFPRLTEYAKHYGNISLTVKYLSNNSSTLGNTWKFTKP